MFVEKPKGYTIISPDGVSVTTNLKRGYRLPDRFEGYSMRKGLVFYNQGLILASVNVENIKDNIVPNPSLLLYEFKK